MSLGLVIIGVAVCAGLLALTTLHGILNHDIGYRKGYNKGYDEGYYDGLGDKQ